jgi:hypothetical protein
LYSLLVIAAAYGIAPWPSGWVIGRVIAPLKRSSGPGADMKALSIEHAGRWIGYLERVMILTFVLLGEFTAIGFLVTAKSSLRFEATRVEGEYILLGTLYSFAAAVVTGVAATIALGFLS